MPLESPARWIAIAGGAVALALVAGGTAGAQGRKLNGPLASSYASDVRDFALAPGGRIVYEAYASDMHNALVSVPLVGSGPKVQLHTTTLWGTDFVDLEPTPDGVRVLYRADPDLDNAYELFSVRTSGGQPPIKLHPSLGAGEDVLSFRIAPDGLRAVYVRLVEEVDGGSTVLRSRIFSVPVDGSEAPVLLSANLQSEDFTISADSARVVLKNSGASGRTQLYSVPIAGGSAPLRLNPPFLAGRHVQEYLLSPDGERAVYRADQETDDVEELFSVPVDGSAPPVKLNGPLPTGGAVLSYLAISPDSTLVTFVAGGFGADSLALYSVPIQGGSAVQLSPALSGGRSVVQHWITPDGARVVYYADQETNEWFELYAVPIDGSESAVKLSGSAAGSFVSPGFPIALGSTRVVFARTTSSFAVELHSAPIDGSAEPVRLHPALPNGHGVASDFRIPPGTERVLFRINLAGYSNFELYSAPIDGSAAAVRLHPALPLGTLSAGGGRVTAFALDPATGQAVYCANQEIPAADELYRAPIDGSAASVLCSDVPVSLSNISVPRE